MTLASVRKGKIADAPVRILVYGVEGIGKSTLAAGAPNPIFLCPEDGTAHLDVARLPQPRDWQDIDDAVSVLISEPHDYQTFVVDTLDWIEPLIWKDVCEHGKVDNIEDFGYGKGYTKALDRWRKFLSLLERLNRERKMHVLLLAHSQVKLWKNPEGEDFDRYTLKLHDKSAGILKEWCDAVLFANYETFADKDTRTKRVKGISTGARLLYTGRTAAFDAKNRCSLPAELPLDWGELWGAIQSGQPAAPDALRAAIEQKLGLLGREELTTNVHERIAADPENATLLSQIDNWLAGKLLQKGSAE